MLLAYALAALLGTVEGPTPTPPPLVVRVHAAPTIPRAVVTMTIDEASAIYRASGLRLAWVLDEGSDGVQVTIDDSEGMVRDGDMAMGWINFASGVAQPRIHLSYGNALTLIQQSEGAAAMIRMTILERNTMLSRALGRALAHELGHYLLGSKDHAGHGLMRARRTAADFFGPLHDTFDITPAQQAIISARLANAETIAMIAK